jgi:hypothetical protein
MQPSRARLNCCYRIIQATLIVFILFAPGELLRVVMIVLLFAGELFHRAYGAIEHARVRQERAQAERDGRRNNARASLSLLQSLEDTASAPGDEQG